MFNHCEEVIPTGFPEGIVGEVVCTIKAVDEVSGFQLVHIVLGNIFEGDTQASGSLSDIPQDIAEFIQQLRGVESVSLELHLLTHFSIRCH